MASQLLTYRNLAFVACLVIGGCGLVYDAGARLKTHRMTNALKVGEPTLEVHQDWGEPDLRQSVDSRTEIWSYADHPNDNDVTAMVFYTSTKPGDSGKFLDLKFIDSRLVSWGEEKHIVPAKQGTGFSYGVGPSGGSSQVSHY